MCKLRLLQHGLIHEANYIDAIEEQGWAADVDMEDASEAEEEDENSGNALVRKRERYVRACLQNNKVSRGEAKRRKHEGTSQLRRDVIKEFLAEVTKGRLCASCGGISPTYRKDGSTKVFEKSLSAKESVKMAQKKLKRKDAMARMRKDNSEPQDDGYGSDESAVHVEVDGSAADEGKAANTTLENLVASQRYISPMEVRARLVELFQKESDIISLIYNAKPPTRKSEKISADMFFMTTILVPPNRYRPEARTGDSSIAEAQQNSLYKSILKSCSNIARVYSTLSEGNSSLDQLHLRWVEVQESVNALIDKNKNPVQGAAAKRNEDGIKQMLEKKEGLFRMNMMGKRVNFAARSVISPDPNIETSEIGVPLVFAKKLTYPEPVTSHNFKDMQQAVINGTEWPGASAIEDENGNVVNLRNKSVDERISLANQLLAPTKVNAPRIKNKKVYRHITNGDVVLMNRQPTLHKPSIMGHRVRVLPGEKTIRMHYANCNTYNADFDGDEMNMHFPQNEVARAEALQIADTNNQYLSGTQGKPLRGLIQDHLSVSVGLCSLDSFFSRSDYYSLVYAAIQPENGHIFGERIQLLPPAVIKPVPRWTGKQVITTILKNTQPPNCGGLTMRSETQLKAAQWGEKSQEGTVLIQDGEFITGILDKAQIGQSSGGMIHAVHEVYGPAVAGKLLSCLSRLLTKVLNMRAFSCGIEDLRLTPKGEQSRLDELEVANSVGLQVASEYVSLPDNQNTKDPLLLERLEEVLRDDHKQESMDLLMNQGAGQVTENAQKACIPTGLEKPFPRNQMQVMTTSGAKGSRINASLISCNLGQQVLEGRRVPLMVSGKSLPCFPAFETNIRAHGYITSRFLTGIRPQEYYFHHMAGREGLIDTAVKTSRSGYLQRCVIKGLEGLMVAYDTTVRDADGSIIQFLYGEDGLDVTKRSYLSDFRFILENATSEAVQLRYDPSVAQRLCANRDDFTKYMKSSIKHAKEHGPKNKDPLISAFNPSTNAFVTSESFYESMSNYVKENKDGLIRDKGTKSQTKSSSVMLNRKNAETLFAMKYLQSLVGPGEAVGIVAGQSVGEPSTQMTLNTFHLAGHAAKNVTQGIPRLREILMTASKTISTPAMTLHPVEGLQEDKAGMLAKHISAVPLSYILDDVVVEEKVGKGKIYDQAKSYLIKLRFFPSEEYKPTYAIGVSDVLDTVEKRLLHRILALVKVAFKKSAAQGSAATPEIGVKSGVVEVARPEAAADAAGGDDDDDDGEGDGDATSAKQRSQRQEAVSYGDNDSDDDEVQRAMDKETADDDVDDDAEDAPSAPREADSDDESDGLDVPSGKAKPVSLRSERVCDTHAEVATFECDEKKGEWCNVTLEFDLKMPKLLMINVVQNAIAKTLIREIRGVGSCTYVEGLLQTEGVNLRAMHAQGDHIDVNRIQTNDIAAVLEMYGVEAARSTIVRELGGVFGSHGIRVDPRHLNLIADYMTRGGEFSPFNRIGLKGNVSPFTKMSFETTLAFLKDAVLDGDWDDLTTPSGRLVMGKLGKLGTGSFDVLTRLPTHHVDSLA